MSPRIALPSLLISAFLSASTVAQVAPPPPPPADPEPEFVPPPPPKPRPVAPKRESREILTSKLPDFPYPPLWTFCGTEDPRVDDVCTFEDNLHFMALRPNPTISPGMLPKIQQVIVARRSRLELMVIDNLNVAEDVDGGLVEEISFEDPIALQELLVSVKPLNPPTNLTQELKNRSIISNTQARFNNKIIGEYQKAYGAFLRRSDPTTATNLFMQSMFKDSLVESIQAFNGMLHESRGSMEAIVDNVEGVPSNVRSKLLALQIDSIEINPALINKSAEKVKLAWRPLSLEQKTAFLKAVRANRENPDFPPVPVVNVMHANKKVVQSEGTTKILNNSENIKNMDNHTNHDHD